MSLNARPARSSTSSPDALRPFDRRRAGNPLCKLSEVGNTPLVPLRDLLGRNDLEVWAKLELHNPGGSSKARSARRMIEDALARGTISRGYTVIESTSGNLGVGLAETCLERGLGLICVVDARTDPDKAQRIRALGGEVRVVTEPDPETGDLLTARLKLVRELTEANPNSWWPDQYSNPSNPAAHRATMAEIAEAMEGEVDWLFVATSTSGTLRGCCDHIVSAGLETKVCAVDAEGSVLFGGERGIRKLPGLGAGIVTRLSHGAWFDRLIRVSDLESVVGCRQLLAREGLYAGASSGGVVAALQRLTGSLDSGARCAVIFADGGEGYKHTVYDDSWVERELGVSPHELQRLSRTPQLPSRVA